MAALEREVAALAAAAATVGVEDMVQLPELTEEAILRNLQQRYAYDVIYTYVGSILLAVNPYKALPIYSAEILEAYRTLGVAQLSPHLFAIADEAHFAMLRKPRQCILISGESGAGKTETGRLLLQALTNLSNSHRWVEEQVVEANAILESFGNAKTARNDNSSRFGKFITLSFDRDGKILGARITKYLLEKSRVVREASDERSFHIFYQLIDGLSPEERDALQLKSAQQFRFLSNGVPSIDGVHDGQGLRRLRLSLSVVGIADAVISEIFGILAAVLHLGNLQLVSQEAQEAGELPTVVVAPESQSTLELIARCLRVDAKEIATALTMRRSQVSNEAFLSPLPLDKACEARDALAKVIYEGVFNWVVGELNRRIEVPADAQVHGTIGVLDMFGFENFAVNSFEQLCINYANEALHRHFNKHIFELEQREYKEEGIDWSTIEYADNTPCVDVFTRKHVGLWALLDEECGLARGSDAALLEKLHKSFARDACYFVQKQHAATSFGIRHYAGDVIYQAEDMLFKNRDALNPSLAHALARSTSSIVTSIVKVPAAAAAPPAAAPPNASSTPSPQPLSQPRGAGGAGTAATIAALAAATPGGSGDRDVRRMTLRDIRRTQHQLSVAAQFQESLSSLLDLLEQSEPHFIRCIKPNERKVPRTFDEDFVLTQLRYTGIQQTVHIRRSGYQSRMLQTSFIKRFRVLLSKASINKLDLNPTRPEQIAGLCKYILFELQIPAADWQIGRTKVFLRSHAIAHLESLRALHLDRRVAAIQALFRGYRDRRRVARERYLVRVLQRLARAKLARARHARQVASAVRIQSVWRMHVERARVSAMRHAVLVLQKYARGWLARRQYRELRAAGRLLQAFFRFAIHARQLETLHLEQVNSEEAARRRREDLDKMREEIRRRQEEYEREEEARKRRARELEQRSHEQLPDPFAKAKQRPVKAAPVAQRRRPPPQLVEELALKVLAPTALQAAQVPTLAPAQLESRRAAVAGSTMAKFAATYFQGRQTFQYSRERLQSSLLQFSKNRQELQLAALDGFDLIYNFMESPLPVETEDDLRAEVADLRRLLVLGATMGGVRDELFCQVCKQIEGNPDPISAERGWFLLALCLSTFSPSEKLLHYVENYVINASPTSALQPLCLRLLARDARREARAQPLALVEWFSVREGRALQATVAITGTVGQTVPLLIDGRLDGADAVAQIAAALGQAPNVAGFALYINGQSVSARGDFVMDAIQRLEGSSGALPKLEFSYRKEVSFAGEYVEDGPTMRLLYTQLLRLLAQPTSNLALAPSVQVLAALLWVTHNGKVPNDALKKLAKGQQAEVSVVASRCARELPTGKGTPEEKVAEMVKRTLETCKGKSVDAVISELVNESLVWPLAYCRTIEAQLLEPAAPVTLQLGATCMRVATQADPRAAPLDYLDIVSLAGTSDQVTVQFAGGEPQTFKTPRAPLVVSTIVGMLQAMRRTSSTVLAVRSNEATGDASMLSFAKGELIAVTSYGKGDWASGYLISDPRKQIGNFPKDAVLLLCGEVRSREAGLFQLSLEVFRESAVLGGVSSSAAAAATAAAARAPHSPGTARARPGSVFGGDKAGASSTAPSGAVTAAIQPLEEYAKQHLRATVTMSAPIRGTMRGSLRNLTLRLRSSSSGSFSGSSGSLAVAAAAAVAAVSGTPGAAARSAVYTFSKDPIAESLHFALDAPDKHLAPTYFQSIMKVMGDYPSRGDIDDTIVSIVEQGLRATSDVWRDELLMQVVKQINGNRSAANVIRGWELLSVLCVFFSPSPRFRPYLQQYMLLYARDVAAEADAAERRKGRLRDRDREAAARRQALLSMVRFCLGQLELSVRRTARRRSGPSSLELASIRSMRSTLVRIYLPPGCMPNSRGHVAETHETVGDVLASLAAKLEVRVEELVLDRVVYGVATPLEPSALLLDELKAMEDDVRARVGNLANPDHGRFEFRKRTFFEADATMERTAPLYPIVLQQMVGAFRKGYYFMSASATAETIALLVRVQFPSGFPSSAALQAHIKQLVPPHLQTLWSAGEWEQRVLKAPGAKLDRESAARALHTALFQSPYFGTQFFTVKQICDPLMPDRILLGINCARIMLIDAVTMTPIVAHHYGEVSAWSASQEKFAMKLGTMASAQRFVAETHEGREITSLLEVYVSSLVDRRAGKEPLSRSNTAELGKSRHSHFRSRTPSRALMLAESLDDATL